jgi:hypothetical protein
MHPLIINALLLRLGLAWGETAAVRSLSLAWAILHLWDYPTRPQAQPPPNAPDTRPEPS